MSITTGDLFELINSKRINGECLTSLFHLNTKINKYDEYQIKATIKETKQLLNNIYMLDQPGKDYGYPYYNLLTPEERDLLVTLSELSTFPYSEIYLLNLQNGNLYYFFQFKKVLVKLKKKEKMNLADLGLNENTSCDFLYILTGNLDRSKLLKGERGYRENLIEAGVVQESICSSLKKMNITPTIYYDFVDDEVHHLLDIDGFREVALSVITLEVEKYDN